MNTEQFIRDSAARGLSRRATMHALGMGPWKFRELLTLMPEITWPARGCSADHQRANEQKRGRCTPAQAAALERAHERWSESRRFTVDGVTGTIAELVEHFQSPVHATTVRRRVAAGAGATGDTAMSSTQHQLIEQCATRLRGIVEALDNIHDNTPHRWSTDLDDVHSSAESLLAMINDQASNQADLAQPSPKCTTCGGAGMVDDGEITCSEGGIPYENGPVKCVKDCPSCKAHPSPTQPEDAPVIGCLCGMPMTEGHHSPDGCCNLEEFAPQAQAEQAEGAQGELERFEAWWATSGLTKFKDTAQAAWQARAALAHAPTSSASPSCKWTESSGIWETGCGQTWSFIEDGPAENGALFCHHCGGRLVLIKSDDQEDDGHGAMGDRDE